MRAINTEFATLISRVAGGAYGDHAIGYVQVKRSEQLCTVKCQMTPEHKLHSKAYEVNVLVDEKESRILAADCVGCAAGRGTCKHAVAFVAWLHRRTEEPASTETTCYWRKSRLSKVGTTVKSVPVTECRRKRRRTGGESDAHCGFLADVLRRASGLNIDAPLFYHSGVADDGLCSIYVDQMVYPLLENDAELSGDNILSQMRQALTDDLCAKAEQATRSQAESRIWHNLRFGRITASKAHEASRCTTNGALVCSILGGKFKPSLAVSRGRELEPAVLRAAAASTYVYECSATST